MGEPIDQKKYVVYFRYTLLSLFGLFLLLIILTNLGAFGKMPSFVELENPSSSLATEVYSADGILLGKYYYENRSNTSFEEIPKALKNALIATEDDRFYEHSGIDFKGEKGDEAKCTANGRVESAGWYGGYGNCVRIMHANNIETLYGHLSRITVKVGQEVTAGQKIGEVGSTGRSTGTHLHYEIRKNGKPVNPVSYLSLNN